MDVPMEITFHNMPHSDALEALIEKRVGRLGRYHGHIIGCRVVVEVPHRSAASAKHPLGIAVEVEVPGRPLIVAREEEERHDAKGDQNAAVTRAFEQVERRLEEDSRIRRDEVKAHPGESQGGMVVRLFPDQNYGFVEVKDSPDLYFARDVVEGDGFDSLEVGSAVRVDVADAEGPMGPQASRVIPRHKRQAG